MAVLNITLWIPPATGTQHQQHQLNIKKLQKYRRVYRGGELQLAPTFIEYTGGIFPTSKFVGFIAVPDGFDVGVVRQVAQDINGLIGTTATDITWHLTTAL